MKCIEDAEEKDIIRKELQLKSVISNTSGNDKEMENRMHPFLFFAQTIENGTNGICNTSSYKEKNTTQSHYIISLFDKEYNGPPHFKLRNHRENTIFF